ncbi:MAG: biotin--[acetyl-CoA-carboxylase] ligase [bacterium]|nr:biotin--[acetyl-CoA-carboxylase] ligase [bacterium]
MIITLETIDSTNNYLKKHPELLDENFFTVQALMQTGGRGRYARNWISKPGLDLTFSTVFIPNNTENLATITFYAGLAVYRALFHYVDRKLKLKWPNDIYYNGRKLGGILCETIFRGEPRVIVGVGININSDDYPPEIAEKAISLKEITGKEFELSSILSDILEQLKIALQNFVVPIPDVILQEWTEVSNSVGERVLYEDNGIERTGRISGLHNDGTVIIKDSVSNKTFNYAGELVFQKNEEQGTRGKVKVSH